MKRSKINPIGKKTKEWLETKPKLIKIYKAKGITRCEISGSRYALDLHHVSKRSGQEAKHTFEGTRLLNQEWHDFCEYNDEANELLIRKPRGFDREYFERFKKMKSDKKQKGKKAVWEQKHKCIHCKRQIEMLLCPHCGEISVPTKKEND